MAESTFTGYDSDALRRRLFSTATNQKRSAQSLRQSDSRIINDVGGSLRPAKAQFNIDQPVPGMDHWKATNNQPLKSQPVKLKQELNISNQFVTGVNPKKHRASPRLKKTKRNKTSLAIMVLAGVLFVTGMFVSLTALRTNHSITSQVSALSKSVDDGISNGVPSETDPPKDNILNFHVAANLPRVIRIPSIGVEARILRMGVDNNDQLKAPGSIFDSGWYDGSSKPGEPGAMLIDGHVSGPTKKGVFYNIHNLKVGAEIQIERGDGKIYNYKVVKQQTYSASDVDMSAALTPVSKGVNGLNLITCSGKYDSKSKEYLQRTIVFAEEQGVK